MDLGTKSYWHSLDRVSKDLEVSGKDFGISHGIGDVKQGLKANIFAGASQVELGFMGTGKGSRSQPTGVTPEVYGKTEREEIREMARVNEVELSTHAAANVMGFAGYSEQGFRDEIREKALHEVKRAVDFAADVAEGGPIVVHTGEFPRDVATKYYDEEKKIGLRLYPEEKETGIIQFVDEDTGRITALKRDTKVWLEKRDEHGNPIPEISHKTGKPTGQFEYEEVSFKRFEDMEEDLKNNPNHPDYGKHAAQLFLEAYQRKDIEQYSGEERRFYASGKDSLQKAEQYEKQKQLYEKFKKVGDFEGVNEELWKMQKGEEMARQGMPREAIESFKKDPSKFYEEIAEQYKDNYDYYKDASMGYGKRVREMQSSLEKLQPIEDYALKKTADSVSQAAMYAYEVEKKKKLKEPLFIAPENVFQEQYGGHPEELKEIIVNSRKAMAQKLMEQKRMSENEAKKVAKDHIKATFDIGHAHNWRKYFTGSDKEYHKWLQGQVKKLAEEGIIGHAHISDNFGYYDEHVIPGEGTAPIKEFIAELNRKGKFKGKMVVEPGGQPDPNRPFDVMKGMWRTAGSPMYRIDSTSQSWTDIENSYFGRTGSPTYLVGDIVPSKDWTLWSETALE